MDDLDLKALTFLMSQGRAPWAELAGVLGMSAQAAADRVRKLEEAGVIKGYAAQVEPCAVGLNLTAFVAVDLEHPRHRTDFLNTVTSLPEVQECHHVAGDYDYLLKIRCLNTSDLDSILSNKIKGVVGVSKTRTTIVLSTPKENPRVPLRQNENRQSN